MSVSTAGLEPKLDRLTGSHSRFSKWRFPLILLLIIIGFYWKLVFTYQFDWVWGPDLAQQVLPWFDEEGRQLHHSRFPLWDPHSWGGQPFLGQAQPGAAYPLNWLLWLLPRQHGHISMVSLQWYYVAIHYMAALFCYLLCRDLGVSRWASMIGGLVFSLGGYVGTTDWPQMVNGAVWSPLVFLFLLRAARGDRPLASAAMCGLALGMSWLSGHHQVPIFLMLASGGSWIYFAFRGGRLNFQIAGLAAVSVLFAVFVGALQILPAQEYGRLALRWVGTPEPAGWKNIIPYYVHRNHSLHPIGMFAILFPAMRSEADPFLGVVACSLLALGIVLCWRNRAVKFFAALALAGLVYSLGGSSIFSGVIYAIIPWVEKARVPASATIIFCTGAAVLAAFGVQAYSEVTDSPWRVRITRAVAGFGAITGVMVMSILFAKKMVWDMDDRVGMTVFCALLMAALLAAWRTEKLTIRQALTLLTMLLILEIGTETTAWQMDRNDNGVRNFIEKAWSNPDLAGFLHGLKAPFRVETKGEDLVPNWGDYYNIDFMQAQSGVTINTFQLETHLWPTKMLLGVKYTLAREAADPSERELFTAASGIKVFENPDAFPRAWAVHEVIGIQTVNESRRFMNDHYPELRWKAFMSGTPVQLPACPAAADTVSFNEYSPSRIKIHANMTCDGMVVLSDTHYPGWYAEVDGRPEEIHEVDLALRGVLVKQGAHDIQFRYRPRSAMLGAAMTFTGVIGAFILSYFSRRKQRIDGGGE